MDLRRIDVDLRGKRAKLSTVDAAGSASHVIEGTAWAPVEVAAAGLLAALETTLGGACHLDLTSIEIEPHARTLIARMGSGEVRTFTGEAYDALTHGARSVGELGRAAVGQIGKRGDRSGSPSEPAFWSRAYAEPTQGWELMRPAPPLERWFGTHSPAGKRALVVGCGRGHEARLLDALGARVVAIDFAPRSIVEAKQLASASASQVDFRERDLFQLAAEPERYDLVVEHCCFCAIEPARRDEYVRVVHEVLVDGGQLVGLFWAHGREGGPPFSVKREELEQRFGKSFTLEHFEVPGDSVVLRAGQEMLATFRRR